MSIGKTRVRRAIANLSRYYQNTGIDARFLPTHYKGLRSPITEAFLHEGMTFAPMKAIVSMTDDDVKNAYNYVTFQNEVGTNFVVPTKDYQDHLGRLIVTPFDPADPFVTHNGYGPEKLAKYTAMTVDEQQDSGLTPPPAFVNGGAGIWPNLIGQGWRTPKFVDPVSELYNTYSILNECMPSELRDSIEKMKKEDEATDGSPPKKITPVHVMQSFDPLHGPQAVDGDVSTILMSGIPSVEWSKCVPYFEVVILDPSFNKLLSPDLTSLHLGEIGGMGRAKYSGLDGGIDIDEKGKTSFAGGVAGAMDLFTMPQTLTPGNPLLAAGQGRNPFAPLMSIESFEFTDTDATRNTKQGDKGTVETQTVALQQACTLKIKIHDRANLHTILPFFRPGGTGKGSTTFLLTYGWSHPDGTMISRSADESQTALIGEVINAARTTVSMSVKDMNYTFTDNGEVELDCSMVCGPLPEILEDATLTSAQAVTNTELAKVLDTTVDMIELMTAAGGGATKLNLGKSYFSALKQELKESPELAARLKSLRAKVQKEGMRRLTKRVHKAFYLDLDGDGSADITEPSDGYNHTPGNAVGELYVNEFAGRTSNIEFSKYSELGEMFATIFDEKDAAAAKKAASRANSSKIAKALIAEVSKGPDPFLRPKPCNFPAKVDSCYTFDEFESAAVAYSEKVAKAKNKFVSLGKVISYFLTPTLISMSDVEEVQLIFHVFNMDAAGMFAHNIASFPIPTADLAKKTEAIVKEKGNLKMGEFLKFLLSTYVNDPTMERTHAFGLKGVKPKDRAKQLYAIYGSPSSVYEKIEASVRTPRVKFRVLQKPMRDELTESQLPPASSAGQSKQILRIEFYDENASCHPFFTAIQDSSGPAILKKERLENRDNYAESVKTYGLARHNHYYKEEEIYYTKSEMLVDLSTLSREDDVGFMHHHKGTDSFVKDVNKNLKKDKQIDPEEFYEVVKSYLYLSTDYHDGVEGAQLSTTLTAKSKPYSPEVKFKYSLREKAMTKILYGADTCCVTRVALSSEKDEALRDYNMHGGKKPKVNDEADEKDGIDTKPVFIIPGSIDLETLGNPFLKVGQEIFVDMGTNTGLDGFYRVMSVAHSMRPGEYVTKAVLKPGTGGYGITSSRRSVLDFAVSTLGELANN